MSWKKNAFSFCIWLLDIILAGAGLIGACAVLVGQMGYLPQYGIAGACVIALVAGLVVLLIHKLLNRQTDKEVSCNKVLSILAEILVVVVALGAGIVLRIQGISGISEITESMQYFEAAKVIAGQRIPQVVHGAVYFYLQVLHVLFLFLGNKIAMAFWMQIILQLLAIFVLYRAVRRMVGKLPSVLLFVFLMCSSWMVQEVLYLSPNMLLLLAYAAVLWVISLAVKSSRIHFSMWLVIGALVAVVSYMDVIGVTLLVPMFGVLFSSEVLKKGTLKKSFSALGMSVLGFVLVFAGIIIIDAIMCGKNILNVFLAWFQVYVPEYFDISSALGLIQSATLIENVVVFALLIIGVFTYWCRKDAEKISLWVFQIVLVLLAQCFGLTAPEADGTVFLYVLLAILASVGIAEMFVVNREVEAAEEAEDEELEEELEAEDAETEEVVEEAEAVEVEAEMAEESEAEVAEESEAIAEQTAESEQTAETPAIEFIPNPLPLPKKHEKKVLDYALEAKEEDDFDFRIEDDDDFDIL